VLALVDRADATLAKRREHAIAPVEDAPEQRILDALFGLPLVAGVHRHQLHVLVGLPQLSPALQVLPMQQIWPAAPHVPHAPVRSHMSGAVQVLPLGQHGWPAPPQVIGHAPATRPTQALEPWSQQVPPAEQTAPGQHASPAPPQLAHTSPAQPRLAAPHDLPAQQIWPAPPHTWQVPPLHASPDAPQVLSAQHRWPAPPHATHCPPAQSTDGAVQRLPGQHA